MTIVETSKAASEIVDCMGFVPKSDELLLRLSRFLLKVIGTEDLTFRDRVWTAQERLDWLVETLIEEVAKWPEGGMGDVRGIYCRFFPPADGKDTGGDSELAQSVRPPAPPVPEQKLLPGPDDTVGVEEIRGRIGEVAGRLTQ